VHHDLWLALDEPNVDGIAYADVLPAWWVRNAMKYPEPRLVTNLRDNGPTSSLPPTLLQPLVISRLSFLV
jgi:hypothetical protein